MATSDNYLLERWHNRKDPRAFREIVQRHGSAVYAVCVRILRNHVDAADVTQECFLEVLRTGADSPPRRLGAWLHGTATNRCLMRLRSDKRRTARELAYAEEHAMHTNPDVREIPRLLDEAIEALPDDLREPIVAHFLHGRSHGAIARDMEVPRRTVSNRIQRGLAQLGAFLRTRGVTASAGAVAVALTTAKANAASLPVAVSESLTRLCLPEAALSAGGAAAGTAATGFAGLLAAKHLLVGAAIVAAVVSGSIWWAVHRDTGNVSVNRQADVTGPSTEKINAPLANAAVVTPSQTVPQEPETEAANASVGNQGSISGTVQAKDAEYHTEKIRSVLRSADSRSQKGWGLLFGERVTPAAGVSVVLESKGLHKETLTDEEGGYCFDVLAPGQYEIYVVLPPGAARTRKEPRQEVELAEGEAKEDVDFTFSMDSATCTGRVTHGGGEPIPGARVTATPLDIVPYSGDDGFDRIQSAMVEAVTDEEGRYRLQGLLPANYREVMDYLGGSTHLPEYGRTYTVRAADEGYASVKIVVPVLQTEAVEFCTAMYEEAGKLPLAQKIALAPDVILPVAPGNTLEGVDFVLYPEARVSGTVCDTQGKVLPDAKVRMVVPEEKKGAPPAFLAEPFIPNWETTGREGIFAIAAVPEGTYIFEVDAGAGFQQARNAAISVRPGDILEDVCVVVESAADRGRVQGIVTEAATGNPVGSYQLWIQKVVSPNEPSPRHGNVTQDSETGAFVIDGISSGLATFEVKAEGFATQRIEVQVEPGRTAELQIPLAREGILRGRVTRNGEPSGSGYVTFPGWEGGPYGGTNEQGQYEVKTLPAGEYLVQYNMWLYEDRRGGAQAVCFRTVEIQAGHVTEVDIQYDGTGVIHGAFAGPQGENWREHNWRVELRDPNAPEETSSRAGTWKFEENGRYEIPDVPAGTYRVVAYCNGPDGTPVEQSQTVTLPDGGTAEVDFAF